MTQRGGAERVALEMTRAFPDSPMLTSIFEPSTTYPELAAVDVRTSFLQGVPAFRKDPRLALPLLAPAWSSMRAPRADVVLASSSGWAHGLRAPEGARKVIYCHNPPRWLHQPDDYVRSRGERAALRPLHRALRRWDRQAATSADLYLANSTSVARRIEAAYGLESTVVFPPVMIDPEAHQEPVPGLEPGFWLTVARGRGYKNVDAVTAGVLAHGESKVAIVGSPPADRPALPHEHWCGVVSDAQLRWLYAHARALVSVSFEDFGLTPLEANSFGTPAVVLRAGGFLDSTDPGVSGWWVDEPTAPAVAAALASLPGLDPDLVRQHAAKFSPQRFSFQLHDAVARVSA
nr:glycosyltransferase [Nocardioides flavescens]